MKKNKSNTVFFSTLICFVCFVLSNCKNNLFEEQSTLSDSLKWTIYSLNYERKVNCIKNKSSDVVAIQLPLEIKVIDSTSDHIDYKFDLKDTLKSCFVDLNVYMLRVRKDGVFEPLYTNINFEESWTYDECKLFADKANKNFIEYLKMYNREIDPWLQKEISRRKIVMQKYPNTQN